MINRNDEFMIKVAASSWQEWEKERVRRANIRKALAKNQPQSYKDRQVERLAGKQYTGGQMARGGAIGAGIGMLGQVLGEGITGGKAGFVRSLKNPRAMAAAGMRGTLVGAVVPTLKRKADVQAAEGGWY